MVKIFCENTGQTHLVEQGLSVLELVHAVQYKSEFPVIGALVNNRVKGVDYRTYTPKNIKFLDVTHNDGYRLYTASLQFLLCKAAHDVLPEAIVKTEHSLLHGLYIEISRLTRPLLQTDVDSIKTRMQELVLQNIPFVREKVPSEDAIATFESMGYHERVSLLKSRKKLYSTIYYLGDLADTFYTPLVPATGVLTLFDLTLFDETGMILVLPRQSNPRTLKSVERPHQKLFKIFREHQEWLDVLGVPYIAHLNEIYEDELGTNMLFHVSEALHEKKYATIAEMIFHRKTKVKAVLIAGPSSSGKTTSCRRISTQLQVLGYAPIQLSLDNYFLNREDTPKDENGEYDFETIDAVDIALFNEQIKQLCEGKTVEIPRFDFLTGHRNFDGNFVTMKPNSILIIEGIHGLNPNLIHSIDPAQTFKVFVSALTQVSIDRHNRISSTDNRLIRRMVRDFNFRGYSALDTLKRWPSVNAGERKHIFPYQEEADVIFNSALLYELGVLKKYAEPLLMGVPESVPEYSEATRLLEFLSYIKPVEDKIIPPTSIMREFLGGSSFVY